MEHLIATEQDLQRYIGQSESIRLEFKASALLSHEKDLLVKELTKEVSAFANTEGGVMIIGIKEGKQGKRNIAVEIDEGTDPTHMPPDRLEALIASNISPAVPGLVVRRIDLQGPKAGRVAFVVIVPKGSTAYQATKTFNYWGRNEFSANQLHDNVIRLLMTRGRVAHAVIELIDVSKVSADEDYESRQASLQKMDSEGPFIRGEERNKLESPPRAFDEYSFSLAIRNDGGVTIRNCLLAVSVMAPFDVIRPNDDDPLGPRPRYINFAAGNTVTRYGSSGFGSSSEVEHRPAARLLYPEQTIPFPGASFVARPPVGRRALDCTLDWKLYLDDAPMCSGTLRLT
jgi:hypothetical protein